MIEIPVGEFVFDARAAGPDDGELVVLLHGFPQTSLEWTAQLDALGAAGYRAIAPDQRGYSPRARPDGVEHYRMDHLVADVLAIVDWLGSHRVHLVGHDWGAIVAWHVAGRYPERLRTLTSVSVPHPAAFAKARRESADQQKRSSYLASFKREGEGEDMLLAGGPGGIRRAYQGASPENAVDEYERVFSERPTLTACLNWYRANKVDSVASMGPVTTPTLYVWGNQDPALGPEAAEDTANHVEGPYRFEVLADVGHWVPEQAADVLSRLLLEHLQTHRGA